MVIKAKFTGTCRKCGGDIAVGEEIEWSRGEGARHVECPPQEDASYWLGGGSGYGCYGWKKGSTIQSSERHLNDGWPEYVTVVASGSDYIREDGMSFGVGDESGYLYWAKCRAATEEESAPVRELIAKRDLKRLQFARVTKIKNMIRKDGERPKGEHSLDGDRLFDTQDIYGGGDWFVICDEYIWYVRNNGADGDDWSHNNVSTGGAGAIGWRVPRTDELAKELRNLEAALGGVK